MSGPYKAVVIADVLDEGVVVDVDHVIALLKDVPVCLILLADHSLDLTESRTMCRKPDNRLTFSYSTQSALKTC